jgi:hypothetical protein
MYCGSCLRDNTLAQALLARGHDVLLIPTYTPTRTDEPNVSLPRVFLGGINVYLQHKWAIFRHTPWFADRWLDSPRLLNWVAQHNSIKTGPARSASCNRSTCSACRRCLASQRVCHFWKRWRTGCPSSNRGTVPLPNW